MNEHGQNNGLNHGQNSGQPYGVTDRIRLVTHGMSAAEVARLTGFNHETVRRYLHGARPSIEFVAVLCRATRTSAHWVLLGDGPREAPAGQAPRDSGDDDVMDGLVGTTANGVPQMNGSRASN